MHLVFAPEHYGAGFSWLYLREYDLLLQFCQLNQKLTIKSRKIFCLIKLFLLVFVYN